MEASGLSGLVRELRVMAGEPVAYRELLLAMARRDLLVRYKQALLGAGWAILSPVLHMLVFTVIFTRVVRLETSVPYPVYVYAGLLPWMMFAGSLRSAMTSLTGQPSLVTKVWFPREVLVFATLLVGLVDFLVAGVGLAGLMLWYRIDVSLTLLALPLVLIVQLVFTAGLALLAAMANLFWRDVRHVADVLLTIWMFSTSVVYPVERVGGTLGRVLALNPMTPIIDAYRAVLLRGELPGQAFAAAAVVALLTLAAGWLVFHRGEPRFAESI